MIATAQLIRDSRRPPKGKRRADGVLVHRVALQALLLLGQFRVGPCHLGGGQEDGRDGGRQDGLQESSPGVDCRTPLSTPRGPRHRMASLSEFRP